MNLADPTPFAILPDNLWTTIQEKSKFQIWVDLQRIFKNDEYKLESLEIIEEFYRDFNDIEIFVETQLRFFLVKNSISFASFHPKYFQLHTSLKTFLLFGHLL